MSGSIKKYNKKNVYQLDVEIDNLVRLGNELIMELSSRLYIIKEQELYSTLGHESFAAYVESKGLNNKTTLARLNVYRTLVVEAGYLVDDIKDISWNKLQRILPEIRGKSKDVVDEWVEKARCLSRQDLDLEKKEEKANEGFDNKLSYPSLWRCKRCGKWQLPPDLEVCTCKL